MVSPSSQYSHETILLCILCWSLIKNAWIGSERRIASRGSQDIIIIKLHIYCSTLHMFTYNKYNCQSTLCQNSHTGSVNWQNLQTLIKIIAHSANWSNLHKKLLFYLSTEIKFPLSLFDPTGLKNQFERCWVLISEPSPQQSGVLHCSKSFGGFRCIGQLQSSIWRKV